MKKFFSLSEFGSCCRSQATPALQTAVREEERGFASEGHAPQRRLRRASSRKCSAAEAELWRPGLPAISEDAAAISAPVKTDRTARSKVVGSTANNKSRRYSKEDARASSVPVIIPVFTPTPFLF